MLSPERVNAIVSGAICYLRDALEDPGFSPVSFRSGLWAMQPTAVMTNAPTGHGIRVDSSVFKGGRVDALGLDYRPAHENGGVWRFTRDVNVPEACGALWEIPIHTQMVPFWRMLGVKRLTLQHRVPSAVNGSPLTRRWSDFLRLRYPRKLDFCRMTFDEMRGRLNATSEGAEPARKSRRLSWRSDTRRTWSTSTPSSAFSSTSQRTTSR